MAEYALAPMELDIKKTVKKSNLLNEVRNSNASLVEYRLFCVYLAHMKMNSENNVVKFRLADYARICGLDRPRRTDLESQANNIVAVTAQVDRPDGGFSVYNLFSEFRLFRENEEWMVSLECNPKIAPMIREQQGKFLRYKLYNTIYLKSYNQQRIYELLKQYQKLGTRVFALEDLREFLSIKKHEYPVWYDFSSKVLKVSQKALKESTDICFDYEPIKKGKKVVQVKFLIYKNDAFVDQLQIDDFMPATVDDAELDDEAGLTVRAVDPDQTSLFDDDEIEEFDFDPEENPDISFIRTALGEPAADLSVAKIAEIRELAYQYLVANKFELEMMPTERDALLYSYVRSQSLYVQAQGYNNFYAYIRSAVINNHANV